MHDVLNFAVWTKRFWEKSVSQHDLRLTENTIANLWPTILEQTTARTVSFGTKSVLGSWRSFLAQADSDHPGVDTDLLWSKLDEYVTLVFRTNYETRTTKWKKRIVHVCRIKICRCEK